MIFHIEPLEKDGIDTIIDIYWRACQDPEADHPLPLILTSGLQQDARALLREEFEPSDGRWEKRYTVAREIETGEIAAVCGWTMNHKALRKGLDVFDYWEDEVLPVRRELHDEFPVRAINVAMFLRSLERSRARGGMPRLICWLLIRSGSSRELHQHC